MNCIFIVLIPLLSSLSSCKSIISLYYLGTIVGYIKAEPSTINKDSSYTFYLELSQFIQSTGIPYSLFL